MDLKIVKKDISISTYILEGECKNTLILNNLKKRVKEIANTLSVDQTFVRGKFTGFESLKEEPTFHSFLKDILPAIKNVYPHNWIIKDAWANICSYKNKIDRHDHAGTSAFCGILYLTEDGPGTFFDQYKFTVKEKIGKFVLFHPSVTHEVKPIDKDIERVTVAFNIDCVNDWDVNKYKTQGHSI